MKGYMIFLLVCMYVCIIIIIIFLLILIFSSLALDWIEYKFFWVVNGCELNRIILFSVDCDSDNFVLMDPLEFSICGEH